MTKYSIITINYNNAEGLEHTINSVVNQTYKDLQFIIIDGGSSDGSIDIIKKYSEKIDYWISEEDNGRYNAMNKGIKIATGKYLNFMNSGDAFHSNSVLEDLSNLNLDDDIITGGFYDKEKRISHIIKSQDVTLLTMLKETFNHQATFYKKELFKNRQYDEHYIIQSDAKFNFLSIINDNCSIKIIDLIIADYDFKGISSNTILVDKEWCQLLDELFPKRILKDYKTIYTPEEVSLVKLLPDLKNSPFIQRISYTIVNFLLKCKHLIR